MFLFIEFPNFTLYQMSNKKNVRQIWDRRFSYFPGTLHQKLLLCLSNILICKQMIWPVILYRVMAISNCLTQMNCHPSPFLQKSTKDTTAHPSYFYYPWIHTNWVTRLHILYAWLEIIILLDGCLHFCNTFRDLLLKLFHKILT